MWSPGKQSPEKSPPAAAVLPAFGRRLASGVYFLRFAVGEHQDVRKVMVIH
jgi:hypothetical protein